MIPALAMGGSKQRRTEKAKKKKKKGFGEAEAIFDVVFLFGSDFVGMMDVLDLRMIENESFFIGGKQWVGLVN